jgi:hypothetical protein
MRKDNPSKTTMRKEPHHTYHTTHNTTTENDTKFEKMHYLIIPINRKHLLL